MNVLTGHPAYSEFSVCVSDNDGRKRWWSFDSQTEADDFFEKSKLPEARQIIAESADDKTAGERIQALPL